MGRVEYVLNIHFLARSLQTIVFEKLLKKGDFFGKKWHLWKRVIQFWLKEPRLLLQGGREHKYWNSNFDSKSFACLPSGQHTKRTRNDRKAKKMWMSLADRNGSGGNIRQRLFDTFVMSIISTPRALLASQEGQRTKRTRNDRKAKK